MSRSVHTLRRRTFLKALGLGLAAPLAAKMSRLASAEPSDAYTRLFIYYIPHGVPVEHFGPAQAGAFGAESAILSPLAPFASKSNVVRGIGMNDGATNHAAIRATLTGFSEGGSGDSIDKIIADTLGRQAYAMGTIPYAASAGFSSDSFLVKHGQWLRPTEDPNKAATDLFAAVEPSEGVDETAFRQAALGLTEAEVDGMQTALSGLTKEKNKLQLHLESIQALKASGPSINLCDGAPSFSKLAAVSGVDVMDQENFGKVLDAHLEVAANAMICGTAPILTLQNLWVNSGLNFGFSGGPGIAKGHHDGLSHSWDVPGREEFAQVQRYFYERLATVLLSALEVPDPGDPSRTVLDNSLVYVCSEVSDGANHNSNASPIYIDGNELQSYLPCVTIGGGGGRINTGLVVDANVPHTDMLATLAAGVGAPITSIGGQSVSTVEGLVA